MQCLDARKLMAATLDHEMPTAQGQSALVPHLKDCKECSEEWTLLNSLEDLLRGEDLISPSPHFEQRVSAQLSTESRRRQQSWQHPFLVVMAMISGLGFVAAGSLFVMSGLQPAAFFGQAIGLVQALSTAFISTIGGLEGILAFGQENWIVYPVFAVILAIAWFAALVLPRTASKIQTERAFPPEED